MKLNTRKTDKGDGERRIMYPIKKRKVPGMKKTGPNVTISETSCHFPLALKHTPEEFWYPFSWFEVSHHVTFTDFHTGLL